MALRSRCAFVSHLQSIQKQVAAVLAVVSRRANARHQDTHSIQQQSAARVTNIAKRRRNLAFQVPGPALLVFTAACR